MVATAFTKKLLTVKEASEWATNYIEKSVTPSNITYLIQYGRVKKIGENGTALVSQRDLMNYYQSYKGSREVHFKERLGDDLNWALSFDQYKEKVSLFHRL
ncbi:hypothetical protein AGMMS49974_05580 [Deltaproteobacteria bacterium]|nr:hypothetical protein AGMMS49974_05580 [Deltaproteobacteria bacterium]